MMSDATSQVRSKYKGRFKKKLPFRLPPKQLRENRVTFAGDGEKRKFSLVDEDSV